MYESNVYKHRSFLFGSVIFSFHGGKMKIVMGQSAVAEDLYATIYPGGQL